MKKRIVSAFLSLVLFIFSFSLLSCGQSYQTDIDAAELMDRVLDNTASVNRGDFSQAPASYLSTFVNVTEEVQSCTIFRTVSSAKFDEIGIIRCVSEKQAKTVFDTVNSYIDVTKKEGIPFAKTYDAGEVSKLENAQAQQLGIYVVFAILDERQSRDFFAAVRSELTQK